MPELSFDDVFIIDKEEVLEKIKENQEAIKVYGIFVMYWMKKLNLERCEIDRREFMAIMSDNPNQGIGARMENGEKAIFEVISE